MSPPCESFLTAEQPRRRGDYPLNVRICHRCLLVQLPAYLPADAIFTDDYAYFYPSDSWSVREAVRRFGRLPARPRTFVLHRRGREQRRYLLQHSVALGIRSLGIEPTANTAARAVERGVLTEVTFLGAETGAKIAAVHGQADLVVANNNVFAHVPDIVDFAKGLRELVADDGIISIEVHTCCG